MMKAVNVFSLFVFMLLQQINILAQNLQKDKPINYLELDWKKVATQMPDQWYGSGDAKAVAENVLFCQQDIGGWAKNKPYHHLLTGKDSIEITRLKPGIGATFDNNATITEMKFLARMFTNVKDERYRKSFQKAFQYILKAQYANGGWPQYYPSRKGKSVDYASHITYNDNAMVNVMTLLRDIYEDKSFFAGMETSEEMKREAKRAFENGIGCILQTQIKVNGQPTVWCAQHDEFNFAPANARAYELASYSGSESVGITLLLMEMKNPSQKLITAVVGAVKWFEANRIEGIKLVMETASDGRKNAVIVSDKNAPSIWARFYDLQTGKPFFCDRDGVKKNSLAEIGYERRNGYGWYTYSPEKVLSRYKGWVKKNGLQTMKIHKALTSDQIWF